jgi:hypothetical protein
MNTVRRALIVLLIAGVVAIPVLLLVGVLGGNQEFVREFVVDTVVSNVDGHPEIDTIVEKVPNDCLQCHDKEGEWAPSVEEVERGISSDN